MRKTMLASPSLSSILTAVPVAERPTATKWTVMVFMGADTVAGNAPMLDAAVADLAEMATVGSGGPLNVFAQVHTRTDVRRGHIRQGMFRDILEKGLKALDPVSPGQAIPANGQALGWFLKWALAEAGHRPDDPSHCSMLVMWGHAYDFAIGEAPTRAGTVDALDFVELTGVLRHLQSELQNSYKAHTPPKFDIVAFDACDVATVELACELEPFARYLLGSQVGVPIPGWPYHRVLERLRLPLGRLMAPTELGSWIVNRFCEAYTPAGAVSLSMLDLNRAPELFARTQILAQVLVAALASDPSSRDLLSQMFVRSVTEEFKPYVDVADLCLNLAREHGDPRVVAAASALGDLLIAPPLGANASSSMGTGLPLVTTFGRNAGETAKLNGISLYAPHVAFDHDFMLVRHLYERFEFVRATSWSPLVHALAQMG